ncbi:MAG: helix-turn-helix domain-containing protein [Solirubrobacterales bacterium]|nr:helix-turn-helix domain-containing protein [Solirubrobacterales bacterium]
MSPSEEAQLPTPHTPELAARLRQLRAEHGLSLSQLARATGISSSFLSLIEQAQSDITIGRLVRLAEFYDVELGDLVNGPPTTPSDHVRILRTAPDHMLRSPTEGVDVYDLTCGARWALVPALSTFRPGGSIEINDEHEHERMIYILEGTFELGFPGEGPTRLRSGEGAAFHSAGRYRITNVGKGQGRVLGVRVHPEPQQNRTVDPSRRPREHGITDS